MRYPRWPERGDIISVVVESPSVFGRKLVCTAVVKKPGHEIRCVYTADWYRQGPNHLLVLTNKQHRHNFHVRLRDKGRTWARGADGPAVEALRVYLALS